MKPNNSKTSALILSVCFLFICATPYAQLKTDRVEEQPSAMPVITKGYYSIYNNAKKLNSSTYGKTSVKKEGNDSKPGSGNSFSQQKGYYSIGRNAEKMREQMTKDRFDLGSKNSFGIIQNSRWRVVMHLV